MTRRVLFVMTSQDELGSSGMPTGSWLEELAQPYYAYAAAGIDVTLASIEGGAAPIDPMSLLDQWKSPVGERFMRDEQARQRVATTPAVQAVDPAKFDAVFLVGGAGAAWDFAANPALTSLIERMHADGKVISSVCHGGVGLADAVDAQRLPLVRGRTVTSVSNAEDALVGFDKIVPVLPEDALRRAGGLYFAAPPFAPNVQRDGNLITGQNPASARLVAEAVVAKLGTAGN